MILGDDAIRAFHDAGFVLGGPVLDDDAVEELRAELDRVIAEADHDPATHGYGGDAPPFVTNLSRNPARPVWQIVDIWAVSEPFRRLAANPLVVEAAAALTEATELRVWHDQIQYKPPHEGGQNRWHQDAPLWPPLDPCGTDGDGRAAQVTAWIALDDADETNGCMTMVRGSHTWGNQIEAMLNRRTLELPAPAGEPLEFSLRPVRKGHVHFHHALTWHASHGNQSKHPRRAIAIHYMSERTRYRADGRHPMERFIGVAEGETVSGQWFPLVHS